MDLPGFDIGVPSDAATSNGTSMENLPVESRDEIFDIATVLTLCNSNPELLLGAIQSMASDLRQSVWQTGESTRAVIRTNLEATIEFIARRVSLRAEIPAQREKRRELTTKLMEHEQTIARLEAEIAKARKDEEVRLLQDEQESLAKEHQRAMAALEATTAHEEEARKARWKEAEPQRTLQLKRLEARADRARAAVTESMKLAAALSQGWVTYRVARFLRWLGYASVAATGTMWTLIVNKDATNDLKGILSAVNDFTMSLAPTFWGRYVLASLVLFLSLLAILVVAVGVDWCLKRTVKNWGKEQREDDRLQVRLTPTSISRRTYVQLVAVLPFLFCGGLVLAFIAVSPNAATTQMAALLPTVTHTFVGSAIALLATATFLMYALKWIEPKLPLDAAPRRSWEFAIAPICLVIAIVVAMIAPAQSRFVWGGWSLFMLSSSLALAYGLVYEGIYGEWRWARQTLETIEEEIQRTENPLGAGRKAEAERLATELVERYVADRLEMEQAARAVRLGRRFENRKANRKKGSVNFRTANVVEERAGLLGKAIQAVVRMLRRFHLVSPPTLEIADTARWEVIEIEAAPALVADVAAARVQFVEVQAELDDLKVELAENVAMSTWQMIEELRTTQANLAGAIAQSEAKDRASQASTTWHERQLLECVRAAIAAAEKLRGPFDDVAAEATAAIIPPPPPPKPARVSGMRVSDE